jgi:hypothetical protein
LNSTGTRRNMRPSIPESPIPVYRAPVLCAAGALSALVVASSASAITPRPVVASRLSETTPAGAPGYLAFSRNSRTHPNRYGAFVRIGGGRAIRVSRRGPDAYPGSIDGSRLVYSQWWPGGKGNIRLFNLATRRHGSLPAGINTRLHEGGPRLSGAWLSFVRSRLNFTDSPRRVFLRNLTTGQHIILDIGDRYYLQNGGLAGNYAVWTRCWTWNRCATFRYDIAAQTKRRLPKPRTRSQFAASVIADGTTFYAESSTILCTSRKVVRFYRQPLTGPRELIGTLARGKDTAKISPVLLAGGRVRLLFDRYRRCRTGLSDIYQFLIP